jgi:cysteinyl-tRNA synthetase
MELYNTLTRQIDEIVPLEPGKLNVFVCGPTVYDYVHVGNAKTYTQSDMLVRYLRFRGYDVTYLQNITDIDDKIIARAAEQRVDYSELAKKFTEGYFEDMSAIFVFEATT